MGETMKVDFIELMDRARAVEQPLPAPPQDNALPPCGVPFVKAPVAGLATWTANIRHALDSGQRARQQLATSLRNAAKAYHDVDEDFANAIDGNGRQGVDTGPTAGLPDVTSGHTGAGLLGDGADDYVDVKTRCHQMESGDQGASLLRFAAEWNKYAMTLRDVAGEPRFTKPFEHWEGTSASAVEAYLQGHQRWLYGIADQCEKVAAKAQDIVAAHRPIAGKHVHRDGLVPGVSSFKEPQVAEIEQMAIRGYANADWPGGGPHHVYAALQQTSDELMAEYRKNLPSVRPELPDAPPAPTKIDPPPTPGPTPGPNPDNGGGIPDFPTMPSVPSVPNAHTPVKPTDGLTGPVRAGGWPPKVGGKPAGLGGLKPASVGATPLQSWGNAEGVSGAAATAGGIKIPAAYAALGGSGMGGGMGSPMGLPGGGKDKDGGQVKRVHGDEAALYIEDRAWTEGIIGIGPSRPLKETAKAS